MPIAAIIPAIAGVASIAGSIIGGKAANKQAASGLTFAQQPSVLGGFLETGNQANSLIGQLLGVGGGGGGGVSALDQFFQSAGGQFILDRGSEAITANQAAAGLLNSGSTLKALTEFGQGVGSTFFQTFLSNLANLSNTGLSAGTTLAGVASSAAGTKAQIETNKFAGIGGGLGQIFGAIPTGSSISSHLNAVQGPLIGG